MSPITNITPQKIEIRIRTAIYISGLARPEEEEEIQFDISIERFDIFKHNCTQNVLTYDHHLCHLQWLEKINLAQKIELTREHIRAIILDNFDVIYDWNLCTAMKHYPIADASSEMNSVKVVQKQSLCQRTLMPCVSW